VPKFKDMKGREWVYPEFTEGLLMEIERELGYDLHKVIDQDEAETKRVFSARGVAFLVWFLLRGECDKRGVTQNDLANAMNYQAKSDASYALYEAIESFSLGPVAATAKTKAIRAEAVKLLADAITEVNAKYGDSPASLD
jgi:hypothetical protein